MIGETISEAIHIAIKAAIEAGKIAREHFGRNADIQYKDAFGDVVTNVDLETEKIILQAIPQAFPDHHIRSEESGDNDRIVYWSSVVF